MITEYHGVVAPVVLFFVAMFLSGWIIKDELKSYDE